MSDIPEILLDVLACPQCRSSVKVISEENKTSGLICTGCKIIYPIRNGIPVMLRPEGDDPDQRSRKKG